MKKWVKRLGDKVFLTTEHKDDGLYELLRRIEELENELEIANMKNRNLEHMYEDAKANQCKCRKKEEIPDALF